MSTKFLLLCAVLLVVQRTSFALNCYACAAGTDGCGGSFKSGGAGVVQIVQTAGTAGCMKTVYASNTNAIARSSSSNCAATTVSAATGSDGYTTYCCTTDLCNGTPMKSASITLAMAVAALSFFYMI